MNEINIITPLSQNVLSSLKSGDRVLISGKIIAARDAAHKRLTAAIKNGEPLPVNLNGAIIYYVGPTPGGQGRPVGAAGPTTSGRMDEYTPLLLEHGLAGMIGKGDRSDVVINSIKEHGAVYFAATGGAGALLASCITEYKVVAWPELGPEALSEMQVEKFPVVVAIDCHGNNIYRSGPQKYFIK